MLLAVVAVVVLAAGWLAIRAVQARHSLDSARAAVSRLRSDLESGKPGTADLAQAQRQAASAYGDTHDPVWWLTGWLPPLHLVRGVTSAVDDLAHTTLPTLTHLEPQLRPAKLRTGPDRISLPPLQAAAPELRTADAQVKAAAARIRALPGGWFPQIDSGRRVVLASLDSLGGSVDTAARFATAGPSMLGADGPRRYFVAIQNNAETRPTGGLVAAYAIVTADGGKVTIDQRGEDSTLRPASHPVVDLGPAYDEEYGSFQPTKKWTQSNLSPNFPDAARIWAGLWQAQSGQHIDGVIAVDPVLLSSLLQLSGPATLPGAGRFTGSNLTQFIESGEYRKFRHNQVARKEFVSRVASAVLGRLLSGSGDPTALAKALGANAGAGHLQLWSSRPAEQAQISGTPIAGELPDSPGPFAAVGFINTTGSKLDYYLQRSLTYQASSCSGPTRSAQITVRLVNTAPPRGLPPYVLFDGIRPERVAREHLFVVLYTTDGAVLDSTTVNGRTTSVNVGTDSGHRAFRYFVTLDPGVPATIRLQVQEPVEPGPPRTKVQPLFHSQTTTLDAPTCQR